MRILPTVFACAASAAVITWLGTYSISPMDPLLAAPAWAFSRLVGEIIEMKASLVHLVPLEQVIIFSRVANFVAWLGVFLLVAMVARRIAIAKRPVV